MAPRSHIEVLPPSVREWLDRALTERNFSGYRELETLLRDKGYSIGRAQISRYGQKVQRRFAAIRDATEAARQLTKGAPDDQDTRSESIMALVQTELLNSLLEAQTIKEEEGSPVERAERFARMAKNLAPIIHASVSLKKLQGQLKKISAEMANLEQEAQQQGKAHVSLDTLKRVREEIYGIIA
ncbi:MAG: DUF3486 family protein [Symbiopectobacterium sp.]|uniref:DUF3486 family protein n=1 Tax=Symbiopectobacterium sp. TaxID=2952789 RepID=UPI0039ECF056